MVRATYPLGIGRYSDWEPSAWLGFATSLAVTAWPAGIDFNSSEAGSIGSLGCSSRDATTTVMGGLLDAFWALRATRTKAAITSSARRIPRIVNGLLNLRPVNRGRTADPS